MCRGAGGGECRRIGAAAFQRGRTGGEQFLIRPGRDHLLWGTGFTGPPDRGHPGGRRRPFLGAGGTLIAEQGPPLVQSLLVDQLGVNFDREEGGELHLTREAAHSVSRVLHHKDHTGRAIIDAMLAAEGLRAAPNDITNANDWHAFPFPIEEI